MKVDEDSFFGFGIVETIHYGAHKRAAVELMVRKRVKRRRGGFSEGLVDQCVVLERVRSG